MNKGQKAAELFKEGYNCCQAVLGAFCEDLGIDFKTAMMLASSFGGGMGRMREVCGAVSGAFMVYGLKKGYSSPEDVKGKGDQYAVIQQMAADFKAETGSIICRELLSGMADNKPIPSPRTGEYYKKRPCGELVELAANIVEKYIAE
ncbi:MAG: C_GCAxxG_C_C family protein [Clostridia bacterium]|nr:C_GCAxxG_C_C family protein [Clostridia bacterium]